MIMRSVSVSWGFCCYFDEVENNIKYLLGGITDIDRIIFAV